MPSWNSALHPRDAFGRFRSKARKRKITRLKATNRNVVSSINEQRRRDGLKPIASDAPRRGVPAGVPLNPLEYRLLNRAARREHQIEYLRLKTNGSKVKR